MSLLYFFFLVPAVLSQDVSTLITKSITGMSATPAAARSVPILGSTSAAERSAPAIGSTPAETTGKGGDDGVEKPVANSQDQEDSCCKKCAAAAPGDAGNQPPSGVVYPSLWQPPAPAEGAVPFILYYPVLYRAAVLPASGKKAAGISPPMAQILLLPPYGQETQLNPFMLPYGPPGQSGSPGPAPSGEPAASQEDYSQHRQTLIPYPDPMGIDTRTFHGNPVGAAVLNPKKILKKNHKALPRRGFAKDLLMASRKKRIKDKHLKDSLVSHPELSSKILGDEFQKNPAEANPKPPNAPDNPVTITLPKQARQDSKQIVHNFDIYYLGNSVYQIGKASEERKPYLAWINVTNEETGEVESIFIGEVSDLKKLKHLAQESDGEINIRVFGLDSAVSQKFLKRQFEMLRLDPDEPIMLGHLSSIDVFTHPPNETTPS